MALALSGFPSEQVTAAPPAAVLATVDGRSITRADFEQFKARIARMTPENAQTDSALLRSLVDKTVLLAEAMSLGIDREPGFRKRLVQFRETQIARRYSSLEIHRKVSVSEDELIEHFHATERDRALRVASIFVPTWKEAEQVLEELEAGASFRPARQRAVGTRDPGPGGRQRRLSPRGQNLLGSETPYFQAGSR